MRRSVVTARLPEEDTAFLDQLVVEGLAKDRTDALHQSVLAMRRHIRAQREIRVVSEARRSQDDLDGLAEFAVSQPLDLD